MGSQRVTHSQFGQLWENGYMDSAPSLSTGNDHIVNWLQWNWSLSVVSDSLQPLAADHQALSSMGFSRQECWSGLPFPSVGDLSHPGIKAASPTLQTLYHRSNQGSPIGYIPTYSLKSVSKCSQFDLHWIIILILFWHPTKYNKTQFSLSCSG